MPDSSTGQRFAALGAAAPCYQVPLMPTGGGGDYAMVAQLLPSLTSEELGELSALAAEILADPLAMQQLTQRVVELFYEDVRQQRERDRMTGRRW